MYCASDRIFSLGPKRSIETNVSTNSSFHDDNSFWLNFRGFIECDKPQGTVYKAPQAIFTVTVEFIGPFFQDLRVVENTSFRK